MSAQLIARDVSERVVRALRDARDARAAYRVLDRALFFERDRYLRDALGPNLDGGEIGPVRERVEARATEREAERRAAWEGLAALGLGPEDFGDEAVIDRVLHRVHTVSDPAIDRLLGQPADAIEPPPPPRPLLARLFPWFFREEMEEVPIHAIPATALAEVIASLARLESEGALDAELAQALIAVGRRARERADGGHLLTWLG